MRRQLSSARPRIGFTGTRSAFRSLYEKAAYFDSLTMAFKGTSRSDFARVDRKYIITVSLFR
jgi:hypothetical protein